MVEFEFEFERRSSLVDRAYPLSLLIRVGGAQASDGVVVTRWKDSRTNSSAPRENKRVARATLMQLRATRGIATTFAAEGGPGAVGLSFGVSLFSPKSCCVAAGSRGIRRELIYSGLSPSTTSTFIDWPSRNTVTVTVSPTRVSVSR